MHFRIVVQNRISAVVSYQSQKQRKEGEVLSPDGPALLSATALQKASKPCRTSEQASVSTFLQEKVLSSWTASEKCHSEGCLAETLVGAQTPG